MAKDHPIPYLACNDNTGDIPLFHHAGHFLGRDMGDIPMKPIALPLIFVGGPGAFQAAGGQESGGKAF